MIFSSKVDIINLERMIVMEWKYVVSTTKENIIETEEKLGYSFPNDFKECVLKNNYGTPEKYIFYLPNGEQKIFGSLLSFNKEDKEYIIDFNKLDSNFVNIALDPFGNYIVYDKNSNEIVYINHETKEVSSIAKSWKSFEETLN